MAMGLTGKQRQFIAEYLIDLNATKAAERSGYSMHTAHRSAQKNMNVPEIRAAIDEALAKRAKRATITAVEVLETYAKIARTDLKDYLDFKTDHVLVGYDSQGKPVGEYRTIVNVKDSDQVDGTMIQEVSIGKDGTFKFKLHDKKGALDSVAKHLNMFKDNNNLNLDLTINVNLVDDDQPTKPDSNPASTLDDI